MKKLYWAFVALSILFGSFVHAQNVGINTNDPKAKLDIVSSTSGILVPRIELTSVSSMSPIVNATISELVYNISTAGTGADAVTPGFYFWTGSIWKRVLSAGEGEDKDWLNSDDTSPDDIIDNIYTKGKVSIGTNAFSGKLHVKNDDDSYLDYGSSGNISLYNPESFTGEVRLGAAWDRPGVYSSEQLELFSGTTGVLFGTADVERMRLTAAGKLGIGIDDPLHDLHVFPDANASIKIGNTSAYTDNRLYFGDGAFNWIGEPGVDNRMQLHSNSLIIEIDGDKGKEGQVLTSDGNIAFWEDAYPEAPISDCDIPGTYELTFTVQYDNYCGENTWEIVPSGGGAALISGGTCSSGEGTFNVTLTYGVEYDFIGYDSYGDGWNGDAWFNLGNPMNTGNIAVSGYGIIFTFSYQVCTNEATRQRIVRGSIQSNGDIEGGGGFNLTSYGSGRYEIEFVQAFSDRPSATVTQIDTDFDSNGWGGNTLSNAIITHLDQNKMRIVTGNSSGTGTDRDFSFVVIGSD